MAFLTSCCVETKHSTVEPKKDDSFFNTTTKHAKTTQDSEKERKKNRERYYILVAENERLREETKKPYKKVRKLPVLKLFFKKSKTRVLILTIDKSML